MTPRSATWIGFALLVGVGAALLLSRRRQMLRLEEKRTLGWSLADEITQTVSNASPHESGS